MNATRCRAEDWGNSRNWFSPKTLAPTGSRKAVTGSTPSPTWCCEMRPSARASRTYRADVPAVPQAAAVGTTISSLRPQVGAHFELAFAASNAGADSTTKSAISDNLGSTTDAEPVAAVQAEVVAELAVEVLFPVEMHGGPAQRGLGAAPEGLVGVQQSWFAAQRMVVLSDRGDPRGIAPPHLPPGPTPARPAGGRVGDRAPAKPTAGLVLRRPC